MLDLVGLGGFGPRYPHELSGGQQQRVALARALAPALMLLDEPFSNLDADLRAQMRDEVEQILRRSSTTAVFATHDQEEAFTLADRVGVLPDGRVEQLAPPQQLYHRPATRFVASFVGAADFLPGVVGREGIVTEVGTFANVDQRPPGDRVDVMIRPDDITFVPEANGAGVIYLAFLPQFIGPGDPVLARSLLLGGLHIGIGVVWLSVLSFGVGRIRPLVESRLWRARLDGVSGAGLIALGLRLAAERR